MCFVEIIYRAIVSGSDSDNKGARTDLPAAPYAYTSPARCWMHNAILRIDIFLNIDVTFNTDIPGNIHVKFNLLQI